MHEDKGVYLHIFYISVIYAQTCEHFHIWQAKVDIHVC